MNPFSEIGKNFAINHNVSFNVYDAITHKLKRHHEGHNAVTNSMLMGIGHYLLGDGTLNHFANDVAEIDVNLIVKYGCKVPSVCKNVQEAVKTNVQNMTDVTVSKVNIVVAGIQAEN